MQSKRPAIKPLTQNQADFIKAVKSNSIIIVNGPSGSGKTFMSVALAIEALVDEKIEKVVLTRPLQNCGESIGFLPGTKEEKTDPYFTPLIENILKFISSKELKSYQDKGIIEICPIAYMRGRSLESSYIIADESQNLTLVQLTMLLTRLGKGSKLVIAGDSSQSDIVGNDFAFMISRLYDLNDVAIVRMDESDIVRHTLIGAILERLRR